MIGQFASVTQALPNGLPGPVGGSPDRPVGSVRRTTSLLLHRPQGPMGPVEAVGRGRDIRTEPDKSVTVLATALASISMLDGVVERIVTHPVRPGTAALVGRPPVVGWRTGLWRYLREEYDAGSALHLVLDDLPGGTIIGGFTQRRAAAKADLALKQPGRRLDVCAGWAADSRAARVLAETGRPPPPVTPPAPSLTPREDPGAWHTLPRLPIWGVTRRRRIDVTRRGDVVLVDAMFRDSFVEDTGIERVLHEYYLQAEVDAGSTVILALSVTPTVLPHLECPVAGASAHHMVGHPVGSLRERVSANLFGPSSCTHLNDLLRSISDVPALAAELRREPSR